MRAAVLREAGGRLAVEDVELAGPGPGEVSVRVEAAGVCHTELHYTSGAMTCPLPVVLGHEGVGTVEAVGEGVRDVSAGQRVAFTWRPRCGQCAYCVTGRPVMCTYGGVQARSGGLMDGTTRLRDATGAPVHHFLGVSCFAERAVLARAAVVVLPDDAPAEVAAVAGCAVVTGVGAVVNVAAAGAPAAGRSLLVVGAGGVGLSAVMGAVLVGADPVVVVDVAPARLQLARELGATHAVDASGLAPEQVVEAVREVTGGGADLAVEAVGAPATLQQAFSALRPGGTLVACGLGATTSTAAFGVNELVQQQKRVVGSLYGSANPPVDLPRLLALHRAGRLPLDRLLGARYALDDVATAYDDLVAGAVGRAVVLPGQRAAA